MTCHMKSPTAGGAAGLDKTSSLPGGIDCPSNAPEIAPAQIKFAASAAEISCASLRADELRAYLIRQISGAATVAADAQIALIDGNDSLALSRLRCLWLAV